MPDRNIRKTLNAVRRRIERQRFLDIVSRGVWWGVVYAFFAIGILMISGKNSSVLATPFILFTASLSGGFLVGVFVWLFHLPDPNAPARLIDARYRLKDRLLTASALLRKKSRTPIESLQIADAAERLDIVIPSDVVPWHCPKILFWAAGLGMVELAFSLILSYAMDRESSRPSPPMPELIEVAKTVREELVTKIEELAESQGQEKTVLELSKKLQELTEQLENAKTDPREALATLSEMENAIRETIDEFQLESVDTTMKEFAEALKAAQAAGGVSKALDDKNYAKAADEMEKLDLDDWSKEQRAKLSEQIKELTGSMEKRGQKTLEESTQKLDESLKSENKDLFSEGKQGIAAETRKQGVRKGIAESLQGKLAMLGMAKAEAAGAQAGNANQDGGKSTEKSDKASKNWSEGTAGKPDSGKETKLDSNRERKNVTGMIGEGESEFERFQSAEGTAEKGNRSAGDTFKEYQKLSEAVLQSEPIPLGQRQMIRRYFESIRPTENQKNH